LGARPAAGGICAPLTARSIDTEIPADQTDNDDCADADAAGSASGRRIFAIVLNYRWDENHGTHCSFSSQIHRRCGLFVPSQAHRFA
jgi:hypothetical protein